MHLNKIMNFKKNNYNKSPTIRWRYFSKHSDKNPGVANLIWFKEQNNYSKTKHSWLLCMVSIHKRSLKSIQVRWNQVINSYKIDYWKDLKLCKQISKDKLTIYNKYMQNQRKTWKKYMTPKPRDWMSRFFNIKEN